MATIQTLIARAKGRNSYESLQYPDNLGPQHVILRFLDFKEGNQTLTVALPPPMSMQDVTDVVVGPTNLGSIGALILDMVDSSGGSSEGLNISAINDRVNKYGEEAAQALQGADIGSTALGARAYFARGLLDSIAPNAGTAVDVGSGTAINPHTTLNFDGVNLKAHTFSWAMSPSSRSEADRIHSMIKAMKKQCLPDYGGAGEGRKPLLKYPDKVEISFGSGLKEGHHYSGIFKPCMVSNISADYTPNGVAMNSGGTPSVINLTISMIEQEIQTREDFN